MPLKSGFGWLNCSLGAVKGWLVKEGWSPGRRANSVPWAQPVLVGVVTRWLSNNTWSAIVQWVSNLFTSTFLNLRNKKSSWQLEITALVSNIASEFQWINEINWAGWPGESCWWAAVAGAPHRAEVLIYSRFVLNLNDDLHFLRLRLQQAAMEVALRRCLLMRL